MAIKVSNSNGNERSYGMSDKKIAIPKTISGQIKLDSELRKYFQGSSKNSNGTTLNDVLGQLEKIDSLGAENQKKLQLIKDMNQ